MIKFTDKFLEVPFLTVDGKEMEITGNDYKKAYTITHKRKIDVSRIEAYEQAIPATHEFDEGNLLATEVIMQSGAIFLVNMPMDKFEAAVNEFYVRNPGHPR